MTKKKRKSGRPTDSKSANTDELLIIAIKAFAKQGYGGVSINSMAKQMGVADSLIHYHFGSKEELWKRSLLLIGGRIKDEIEELFKVIEDLDGLQQLRLFNKKIVFASSKYPEFQQIVVQEVFSESPRSEWLIDELLSKVFKKMIEVMDKEKAAGRIKDIPNANLTSFIIGAITTFFSRSYMMKKVYGVDTFSPDQVENHAAVINDLIFGGLVATSD